MLDITCLNNNCNGTLTVLYDFYIHKSHEINRQEEKGMFNEGLIYWRDLFLLNIER